jgi:catechol 2,3-dioxygenase-like lactoylglutathione lyase family enzyme
MTVELNHTIVWCRDQQRSAAFLTEILGRPPATRFGPFLVVEVDNGISLDYHEVDGDIVGRIAERGLDYWADPMRSQPGSINHHDGGRGVYFPDPDGHLLEIITRPYGSGS